MSAQIIHISQGTLRLTVYFYIDCKANVFHTGASDISHRGSGKPQKIHRPQSMNPCLAVTFYGSSGPYI